MFGRSKWDVWPCTHSCTAFFHIAKSEVSHLVPAPLVVEEDGEGRAQIVVSYIRFRAGTHSLPATEELAWGIAVKRIKGLGLAIYAMNVAADNVGFLDYNAGIGFDVHRPPVRFDTDLDRRTFRVEDDAGPICTLRHQPEGSLPLPFLPFTTEDWTGRAGSLERRLFKWRGVAKLHLAAAVATTLHDHPFFRGARVSRANPVPAMVLSSTKVQNAAQCFSAPTPYA
ncbi:MAG: hypothetical protein KF819_19380 [Labilithrix sp.]|nr:hypothetical protein [Labilithrix sp.]